MSREQWAFCAMALRKFFGLEVGWSSWNAARVAVWDMSTCPVIIQREALWATRSEMSTSFYV